MTVLGCSSQQRFLAHNQWCGRLHSGLQDWLLPREELEAGGALGNCAARHKSKKLVGAVSRRPAGSGAWVFWVWSSLTL